MPTRPRHHPWAVPLGEAPPALVPARTIVRRSSPPNLPPASGPPVPPESVPPESVPSESVPPEPVPPASVPPESVPPASVCREVAGPPASEPIAPPRDTGLRGAEDGSVATEYGLLAVVAATIVSVLLEWATSGGISALLGSILARVADLVGL